MRDERELHHRDGADDPGERDPAPTEANATAGSFVAR